MLATSDTVECSGAGIRSGNFTLAPNKIHHKQAWPTVGEANNLRSAALEVRRRASVASLPLLPPAPARRLAYVRLARAFDE